MSSSHSLPGYSGSEDSVAMETLLQGYDEQDEDQVYRICNSPLLKYMDNDVSLALWVPARQYLFNSIKTNGSSGLQWDPFHWPSMTHCVYTGALLFPQITQTPIINVMSYGLLSRTGSS